MINELVLPHNRERLTSAEIRLQTKRKGALHRVLQIDKEEYQREHAFEV